MGTLSALENLTLDDVRDFLSAELHAANLVLGLAGGYPADLPARSRPISPSFRRANADQRKVLDARSSSAGTRIEIIKRETRSTAISLGFPIDVTRATKIGRRWRSSLLTLASIARATAISIQRLREARGLNYGDYAYIEYFPRGMFQFQPDPNLGRQLQIFQIWIRPVEPQNGHFTLRAALYEYDKLVREWDVAGSISNRRANF